MSRKQKQTQPSTPQNDYHYQELLDNPIPSPAYSSSASQTSNNSPTISQRGFSSFNVNPFSQPFYNQIGFPPVPPQFLQQQYQFQSPQQQYQFQSPQQQYQFQSQQQNYESPPSYQPESEHEINVPNEPKEKGKGKRVQVKWTDEEAVILAQRWIGASENSIQGNSQSEESFWKTIISAFNAIVETPRTKNQLTGKWNKIRTDVKLFGGIIKKYTNQGRQSGADEKSVYDAAKNHFKAQQGRAFIYESCYHELKDYPKFWNDLGASSQKRSFHDDTINLDEDEVNPNQIPSPNPNMQMEALFRDDPLRRPPGKYKSQKSNTSSDATSSRKSEEVRDSVTKACDETVKALKVLKQRSKEKAMFKAFKVLNTPISNDLPEEDRLLLEESKRKFRSKYRSALAKMQDED